MIDILNDELRKELDKRTRRGPNNKDYYKRLQKSANDCQQELIKRRSRIAELEQALRDATGAMMQAAGLHKNLSLLMKAEELRKIAEVSDV